MVFSPLTDLQQQLEISGNKPKPLKVRQDFLIANFGRLIVRCSRYTIELRGNKLCARLFKCLIALCLSRDSSTGEYHGPTAAPLPENTGESDEAGHGNRGWI